MIHRHLDIGRWKVDFLFAADGYDTEEGLDYLYDADASDHILVKAYHVLEDNKPNTGFTFTNGETRQAVVVIGPTTSGDEFINTFCHEMYHLANAIAKGLGLDTEGETPAYIIGDTAEELTSLVCKLGCSSCD